jgi:hypothetical protein
MDTLDVEVEMNDGKYRSIFHSPMAPSDAFRAARDEMRAWLRIKSYDLDAFDAGVPRVSPGAMVLHSAANSADGSQTERWQLREARDDGAWVSSLTVHAPAQAPGNAVTWFWVEIEFTPGTPDSPRASPPLAGVPGLERGLLTAVPAYDSLAMLTSTPVVLTAERVDALIDVLCDPDRRLPALVASAHPALSFEDWRTTISRVMWYLPGLASTYILDPLATTVFAEAIGHTHAVWGGAVRTYLPDVDPAVAEDAPRHRVLSAARIAADPARATGIVSAVPRRLAAEAPLPRPLARVNRALLTQASAIPDTIDRDGLRVQVARLADERDIALNLAEEQETRANSMFGQRETALAELAEREQQLLQAEGQLRALRRRLVVIGQPEDAFLPVEEAAEPPGTFAELLDWMKADLRHVEFTGDIKTTLELDMSPESATWVRSSWEVLRALESYAGARAVSAFAGDFKTWCEKPPAEGYAIPAGKVARDESETVRNNPKWRRQREFPVPPEIEAARRVFMGAHVRIGASAGGQVSPRLYYYDATAQAGTVYVGYLGRHLTNTRT